MPYETDYFLEINIQIKHENKCYKFLCKLPYYMLTEALLSQFKVPETYKINKTTLEPNLSCP